MKKIAKKFFKSDFVSSILCMLIYAYVKLIEKTTKWQRIDVNNIYNEWHKNKSIILCGWHGRILMLPIFWNQKGHINALVSLHRDGRIIANLLEKFKFGIISGSSNKNSSGAALSLMRSLENDTAVAIIPDGPRGPARTMTNSPIYYAHKTGKPIIGMTYCVKNSLIAKQSWDKMMIPLPFSKGVFIATKPFYVPKDAQENELETYRLQFEKILNDATDKADRIANS